MGENTVNIGYRVRSSSLEREEKSSVHQACLTHALIHPLTCLCPAQSTVHSVTSYNKSTAAAITTAPAAIRTTTTSNDILLQILANYAAWSVHSIENTK